MLFRLFVEDNSCLILITNHFEIELQTYLMKYVLLSFVLHNRHRLLN